MHNRQISIPGGWPVLIGITALIVHIVIVLFVWQTKSPELAPWELVLWDMPVSLVYRAVSGTDVLIESLLIGSTYYFFVAWLVAAGIRSVAHRP